MRIFLVASLVCCSHCNTAQSAMSLSIFPPWGSRKGDNYCNKDGVDDIDGRSMNIHIPSMRLTKMWWWWRWGWWLYDIDGRCHYYDTQENLGCTLGDWWEHFFLFCSITKTSIMWISVSISYLFVSISQLQKLSILPRHPLSAEKLIAMGLHTGTDVEMLRFPGLLNHHHNNQNYHHLCINIIISFTYNIATKTTITTSIITS